MNSAEHTTDVIYGGVDPRDLPRYSYSEAARATGVPATTIGGWVRGQDCTLKHGGKAFFRPVIERPGEGRLSFYNLIEVHVLRSLRTKHAVQLQHVREAAEIAEAKFNLPKLLLSEQLRFGAGDLFLEQYGRIVQLSRAEQMVMQSVLSTHLDRIEFGAGGLPRNFSPLERIALAGRKLLLVSPAISFGRPIVRRLGVTTRAIAESINLGESADELRNDYRLEPDELNEALAFESAA